MRSRSINLRVSRFWFRSGPRSEYRTSPRRGLLGNWCHTSAVVRRNSSHRLSGIAVVMAGISFIAACSTETGPQASRPSDRLVPADASTSTPLAPVTADPTTAVRVAPSSQPTSTTVGQGGVAPTTTAQLTTTTSIEVAATIPEKHTLAKEVATDVVTKLTTYSVEMEPVDIAAKIVGGAARIQRVVGETTDLYIPGADSSGSVLFAQVGGMRPTSTSIMVVVRQELDIGGVVEAHTRTVDVRLAFAGGIWRFDAIADAGGRPVQRPPNMFPESLAVVENDRIILADSARWDIYRGDISPTLTALMSEIADRTTFAVTVLSSGHPFNVFGTNRQSLHTRGRAVDIFSIDGVAFSSDHSTDSDLYEFVLWLYDHPNVSKIGSPWDIDGPGGKSFTDEVHLDHVHVALFDESDDAP